MPDPAPIRGRWMLYPVRSEQIKVAESDDHDHAEWVIRVDGPLPPHPVQACPLPDEAAIERGALALRRVPRRAINDKADDEQLREWARLVLRAALEPPENMRGGSGG